MNIDIGCNINIDVTINSNMNAWSSTVACTNTKGSHGFARSLTPGPHRDHCLLVLSFFFPPSWYALPYYRFAGTGVSVFCFFDTLTLESKELARDKTE